MVLFDHFPIQVSLYKSENYFGFKIIFFIVLIKNDVPYRC